MAATRGLMKEDGGDYTGWVTGEESGGNKTCARGIMGREMSWTYTDRRC